MSSTAVDALSEATITVPACDAAAAVARSPSSQNRPCIAVGATSTGVSTAMPSTVVDVSTFDTSRKTCGRRRRRAHASTLPASVTSCSAPLARYSDAMSPRHSAASRSSATRSSIGAARSEADIEPLRPLHHEEADALIGEVGGQPHRGDPVQDRVQSALQLEPGERRSDAEMHAPTEAEVLPKLVAAAEVEV